MVISPAMRGVNVCDGWEVVCWEDISVASEGELGVESVEGQRIKLVYCGHI